METDVLLPESSNFQECKINNTIDIYTKIINEKGINKKKEKFPQPSDKKRNNIYNSKI